MAFNKATIAVCLCICVVSGCLGLASASDFSSFNRGLLQGSYPSYAPPTPGGYYSPPVAESPSLSPPALSRDLPPAPSNGTAPSAGALSQPSTVLYTIVVAVMGYLLARH